MSSRKPDAFDALADPTRRSILELLRDSSVLSAGEVATRYPNMSRAAVSKHLAVLRKARLVRARSSGRQMHYRLAAPSLVNASEWLSSFAPYWEQSLARLKHRVESDE